MDLWSIINAVVLLCFAVLAAVAVVLYTWYRQALREHKVYALASLRAAKTSANQRDGVILPKVTSLAGAVTHYSRWHLLTSLRPSDQIEADIAMREKELAQSQARASGAAEKLLPIEQQVQASLAEAAARRAAAIQDELKCLQEELDERRLSEEHADIDAAYPRIDPAFLVLYRKKYSRALTRDWFYTQEAPLFAAFFADDPNCVLAYKRERKIGGRGNETVALKCISSSNGRLPLQAKLGIDESIFSCLKTTGSSNYCLDGYQLIASAVFLGHLSPSVAGLIERERARFIEFYLVTEAPNWYLHNTQPSVPGGFLPVPVPVKQTPLVLGYKNNTYWLLADQDGPVSARPAVGHSI